MADRIRSKDGTRETELFTDDLDTPGQQGRAQGNLERKVGTRDELNSARHGKTTTRVRKADEKDQPAPGAPLGSGAPDAETRKPGNGTWVLIADGEKALFLENVTDDADPHLQVRRVEQQDNPKDIEQSANRPGRMQEGRPGGETSGPRSAFDDTDWHALAKERFATDLSDILYKQAHRGAFERLIIVAAPKVLGDLRKALHQEVTKRIIAEVPKTLTNHAVTDVERLVAEELAKS